MTDTDDITRVPTDQLKHSLEKFGRDLSYQLRSRSKNESVEKCVAMTVAWMFRGIQLERRDRILAEVKTYLLSKTDETTPEYDPVAKSLFTVMNEMYDDEASSTVSERAPENKE